MKITESMMTDWFPAKIKPIRSGEYEARERITRRKFRVYWRKIADTDYYDWYIYKGTLGPFNLWECVSHNMTSWRGLKEKPNE
jgi:penicillin-binding protein-related factor A (putative recombinase)